MRKFINQLLHYLLLQLQKIIDPEAARQNAAIQQALQDGKATIEAKVIRANGQEEDLGVISKPQVNPTIINQLKKGTF